MQTAPVFKQASIRPGNKTMPAPVWCSVVLRAPGEQGSRVGEGPPLEPDRMGSKEKRRIPGVRDGAHSLWVSRRGR